MKLVSTLTYVIVGQRVLAFSIAVISSPVLIAEVED
jgi:hypothetical protein